MAGENVVFLVSVPCSSGHHLDKQPPSLWTPPAGPTLPIGCKPSVPSRVSSFQVIVESRESRLRVLATDPYAESIGRNIC